ncbi:MAG TPA: carbohydrate-binding family 9-like protein [Phycisphaeraceae bacterium]
MAGLMIGAASIAVLSATLSASSPEQEEAEADPAVMTAARAQQPVVLDGRLDDPVWSEAPVYELGPTPPNSAVLEGGRVQLAWDDQFLYVAATVLDSDVVAESDEDQAPHFRTGDVVEVFLKPQGKLYYWELYATPHARKTAYFFPSRGRGWLPSSGENPIAMHVAAAIDGTLNDWKDRDHGWTAEIAIPQAADGLPHDPARHAVALRHLGLGHQQIILAQRPAEHLLMQLLSQPLGACVKGLTGHARKLYFFGDVCKVYAVLMRLIFFSTVYYPTF